MHPFATALLTTALAMACGVVPLAARAQGADKPANVQAVVPQVERREVKLPPFPSKDFSVGLFAGTYGTENFGSSGVGGSRLGYHISEDFFAEAAFGRTKVSDETFRRVLRGGVFPKQTQTLSYYNLSAGVNVLPGEVFIGRNTAKASTVYLICGVGSTRLNQLRRQTVNVGFGLRVLFFDRTALQIDMRDHVFSLDLLGKRQSTQNLELTAGFTYFF